MAATNLLSVGQFFLLNNSLKCLNIFKRHCSAKKVADFASIPPKPKRPTPPFAAFLVSRRGEVMANNPGKSFKEITRLLSDEWRSLSELEKNKYREDYFEKHAAYKNKLLEYKENYGELVESSSKVNKMVTSCKSEIRQKRKLQIQHNKPQFPHSCYAFFIQENMSKVGSAGQSSTDKMKKCAELWKNMSKVEKDNFKKIYEEKLEQYNKDLSDWEESMMQEGKHELVRPGTVRKKFFQE